MSKFTDAHEFTHRWEGGFVNHPSDPGGATKYGISLRFLQQQGEDVGDIDEDGDVDLDDILALTPETAAEIMEANFWTPLQLNKVPPKSALVVYDTAVNMGTSFARRMAQRALGIQADGIWGPLTWEKWRTCDDDATARAMLNLRRARYVELTRNNPKFYAFQKGWFNRVAALSSTIAQA